jgi:hypothetical protein
MVKSIIILVSFSAISFGSSDLEMRCLGCHKEQKIPSELVYRRYLLKYSDRKIIKDRILNYLKNPKKENSIMPKQFFLKFPMKRRLDLNSSHLVDEYMKFFNIKNRLKREI